MPALILAQFPKLVLSGIFTGAWWLPVLMPWLHFVLAFSLFWFVGKKLRWSQPKTGALILTAGLGNTSFVGFPLLEALIGSQAIPIGILVDQPGSFLVLSTLGILTAASFSGEKVKPEAMIRKVIFFPPMIALMLALIWALSGIPGSTVLSPVFEKIASTLVPLALFAVGFQLRLDPQVLRKRWVPLTLGLGFKLVLAPAFFAILYIQFLNGQGLVTQVTVLEAAMAPMITSAVVASDFRLDTEIANLMVGIGIPVSIASVSLWAWLLQTWL